jgi:Icc-related predicted phosphoesterase
LSETTALAGHDGWADGRLGLGQLSEVLLNDHFLIEELSGLRKPELFRRLRALGDEAAQQLGRVLEEALQACPRVILLTHVPPFREASWHEGRLSDGDHLPHFASQAAGETILEVLDHYPGRHLTVLCGHTHSRGQAQIRPNLLVQTGIAEYGRPVLQAVIEA